MDAGVTATLAEFVSRTSFASLPGEVRNFSRLCILDQLGAQAYGAGLPSTATLRRPVLDGSTGGCTVVGSVVTASAEAASFANAVAGYGCELDDVHLPSLNHPGAAVVPAALAVGELTGASGQRFIAAVALGYEVMSRVGRGLTPRYAYGRGFHPQGVIGPLGAAVAAGVLLDLDERQLEHAMSLAVSHASGTLAYTRGPGDTARLHAGLGAMSGVRSALLARAGVRGPNRIVEGRYGLAEVYAGEGDAGLMTGELGTVYSLLFTTFKVRPYHALVHAAVDVALEALIGPGGEEPTGWRDVDQVILGLPERAATQASLPLYVAHAIAHRPDLAAMLDLGGEAPADPETLELARRITVVGDPDCEREYEGGGHRGQRVKAKAAVVLRNGRRLEAVNHARGSAENPVSADEIEYKFRLLLSRTPLADRSDAISTAVRDGEGSPDVGVLARLLRPGTGGGCVVGGV